MVKKSYILNRRLLLTLLLSLAALICVFQTAKAADITSATLNKETYLAGQIGSISVAIYNDKNENISVTELNAAIDYYYTNSQVYVQKFFTSADLPEEIEPGQTGTYQIPISLPTNIAPGYVNLIVAARTELWVNQTQRWISSDNPTYLVNLYIESPYKQSYENSQNQLSDSREELKSSQDQLEAQESTNQNLRDTANVLGVTTLAFGAAAVLLVLVMLRRPRPINS
jgi:hypothetical protein